MKHKEKVAVALSGGVDSAFCAYLLLKEGYKIEAFTLKIPFLPADYFKHASLFCAKFGIIHHIIDVEKKFHREIIKYFVNSYLNGITPNPCALCNRIIKFGLLLSEAKKRGFNLFATGHYVDIIKKDSRFYIKKSSYERNSQEYFLALLHKDVLKYCLFPLGGYTKEKVVEEMARVYPFSVSSSQEVCFVRNKDYREFISGSIKDNSSYEGFIRYHDGRILARHSGIYNYTCGQREGIGVSWPVPLYVLDINSETKDIVVAEKELVLKDKFYVVGLNWFYPSRSYDKIFVKLRYNGKLLPCAIKLFDKEKALCVLRGDKGIPSPGQLAVFYDNDIVIAGGIIEK